jgi:hypothetical protein
MAEDERRAVGVGHNRGEVFILAFGRERLGVATVAAPAAIVGVDSELVGERFGATKVWRSRRAPTQMMSAGPPPARW